MADANTNSQRIAGGITVLFGALFALNWMFQIPIVDRLVPAARMMGLNTPLMLLASGLFLVSSTIDRFQAGRSLAASRLLLAFIGSLSTLILVEHVFQINLGMDFPGAANMPTAEMPIPGRVAPNTCVAFLLAALSLYLSSKDKRSLWQTRAMVVAAAGVTIVSTTALVGHFLKLSSLYQFASYNRMLAPTALALFILSIGIWLRLQALLDSEDQSVDAFERRITRRSAGILAMVAISTGVAGFSIMEEGVETSTSQNLLGTAVANGAAFAATLETRLWFSQMMQSRPSVIRAYTSLQTDPDDLGARQLLGEVGASVLTAGVRQVRFLAPDGQLISASGRETPAAAPMRMPLNPSGQLATLVWQDGFYLQTENLIVIDNRTVGKVVMDQALPDFQILIGEIEKANATTEVLICGRTPTQALCAPSRFYNAPRVIPLYKADGRSNLPFMPNELTAAKVSRIKDIRGIPSVIAYTPVRNFGIGLVLKVDADTLYASIRGYVVQLMAVIFFLVVLGALSSRLQVRPLLARVVHEQTRNRIILANSNDAFIGMDSDGRVTDWNARAESLFQWTPQQAVGQLLAHLIVPPEAMEIHLASMAEFKRTGSSPTINTQREAVALRRDGSRVAIDVSTTGYFDGKEYVANAFIRDITGRKAAEEQLKRSETRLQAIANNLPALITHVDLDEKYTFVNSHIERVFGLPASVVVGRTMRQICGEPLYSQISPHIKAGLSGQATEFEGVVKALGADLHFQANYIPEFSQDGEVTGFYALTFDITDRKRSELLQAESEERLRLIADNLPVLIAYVDTAHRFQFGNATFMEWFGVPPEMLIGTPIVKVVGETAYRERLPYFVRAFDGETVHFEITTGTLDVTRVLQTVYVPHRQSDGRVVGLYTISTDVTALKKIERELAIQARVDSLTGLPNRREFDQRMIEALARCNRSAYPMALMFLDIDKFKEINDRFGHAGGDEVLQQFASRLRGSVRKTDFVARLAGDEFMVIVGTLNYPEEVALVAEKILSAIREPMTVSNMPLLVTSSIGVTIFDGSDTVTSAIVARADKALYDAKASGRNIAQLSSSSSA